MGRFYAGVLGAGDYNGALLMRIDNDLTPKVIQCDIHGHNGLAFSPISSGCLPLIRRTVLSIVRRWMSRGAWQREVFRRFKEGEGIPDGAAMDVEGCYWSALFDGWRIARFSPQGEQLEESAGALPDDGLLWRR
jgi:sugar lactone lactonase YvrE